MKTARKRGRKLSIEMEIRAKARQIMDDQMAEAMKAAALMIVGRKLDEIRAILQGVGLNAADLKSQVPQNGVVRAVPSVVRPPVERPCVQCGREGVKRTRPNPWNRVGSWYCAAHIGLANVQEFEDAQDQQLLGSMPSPGPRRPTVIQNQPPAQIQPTSSVAEPVEPAGAASMEDAFAALGVESAQ